MKTKVKTRQQQVWQDKRSINANKITQRNINNNHKDTNNKKANIIIDDLQH